MRTELGVISSWKLKIIIPYSSYPVWFWYSSARWKSFLFISGLVTFGLLVVLLRSSAFLIAKTAAESRRKGNVLPCFSRISLPLSLKFSKRCWLWALSAFDSKNSPFHPFLHSGPQASLPHREIECRDSFGKSIRNNQSPIFFSALDLHTSTMYLTRTWLRLYTFSEINRCRCRVAKSSKHIVTARISLGQHSDCVVKRLLIPFPERSTHFETWYKTTGMDDVSPLPVSWVGWCNEFLTTQPWKFWKCDILRTLFLLCKTHPNAFCSWPNGTVMPPCLAKPKLLNMDWKILKANQFRFCFKFDMFEQAGPPSFGLSVSSRVWSPSSFTNHWPSRRFKATAVCRNRHVSTA